MKYDTKKIMSKVQAAKPTMVRQMLKQYQDKEEANKTLDKARQHEIRAVKKEAQVAKDELRKRDEAKKKATEKAQRTRAKNSRAKKSSSQKKS